MRERENFLLFFFFCRGFVSETHNLCDLNKNNVYGLKNMLGGHACLVVIIIQKITNSILYLNS